MDDLRKRLIHEKIPLEWYSLDDFGESEKFTLLFSEKENKWHFFYLERGNREEESFFDDEAKACDYMLNQIFEERCARDIIK